MDILVITRFMNGFLMIGLPVALGFFLTRRFHIGWRLWWIGAATFIISQVGHIPFNWIITRLFALKYLPTPPAEWSLAFNAVFIGLSAGLFEELARAGVYRWWADDARSWRKGVLFGAGHGGAEAIILGVLVLNSFVNMLILRGPEAARLVPPAQMATIQQQVTAYWSAFWPLTLLGAVERVFALTVQVSLSVLVLQAFTRKQPWWIIVAILWHAVVDGVSVYFGGIWKGQPWSIYALEGLVGLSALIGLGIIFALRRSEPEPEKEASVPAVPPAEPPAQISTLLRENPQVRETEENLDSSRYSS